MAGQPRAVPAPLTPAAGTPHQARTPVTEVASSVASDRALATPRGSAGSAVATTTAWGHAEDELVTAFPTTPTERVTALPHRGPPALADNGGTSADGADAVAFSPALRPGPHGPPPQPPSRRKKTLPTRPTASGGKATRVGASTAAPAPTPAPAPAATPAAPVTPRTPNTGQPLLHMDVAALPLSSPLASMASLGGPPMSVTRPPPPEEGRRKHGARRLGLWKRSKRKTGLSKDMIGLPESFKHVSHTAPEDVGPLLSALHVADLRMD